MMLAIRLIPLAPHWKPSRLKPEFFEKQDEAKEINATFIKEANELQKVATI